MGEVRVALGPGVQRSGDGLVQSVDWGERGLKSGLCLLRGRTRP